MVTLTLHWTLFAAIGVVTFAGGWVAGWLAREQIGKN